MDRQSNNGDADMGNDNIAEEAFGVYIQKPSGVILEPKIDELERAMLPGSHIKCFCTACGRHFALTKEGAEEVASNGGLVLPEDTSRHYLKFASCATCKTPVDGPVTLESF